MNNLKNSLKEGKKIFGTMVTEFSTPNISKMLSVCGFDYFMVDCEHGYFDYSQVANIISVGKGAGIPVIVRIPEVKRECVLKYIEMGAAGLLIPQVESAEQMKAVVRYSKYAPMGSRGVSLSRPHTGYEKVNAKEYMQKANDETIIIAQIESPEGVENIDNIAAVPGVDVALIGPNDLSQSMGMLQQFYEPVFIDAIQKVVDTSKKHGIYAGIHSSGMEYVKYWAEKGMQFLMWNSDIGMMMSSAKKGVEQFKSI